MNQHRPSEGLTRITLRARLIALVALVLFVSVLLGGMLAWWHAAQSSRAEMQAALASGGRRVRDALAYLPEVADREGELRRLIATFNGDRHVRATLVDARGGSVARSTLSTSANPTPDWFYKLLGVRPTSSLIALASGIAAEQTVALATDPHNEVSEVWIEFRDGMLIVLVFCALSFALIYWMAGRSLRPLETLAGGFRKIGTGDYRTRVSAAGPPEIEALAHAFNLMAERLGALEERNERLHMQLLTIQEEERADLARDLHDDVGPFLFAVNVDVASIVRLATERADAETLERGRSIREAVSHMQKHVKAILGRLRPTGVADIGLAQAVSNLGVFWRRRHPEIAIEFDMGSPEVSFGDAADATLYRLIQESLTNAIRHGSPRNIRVRIALEDDGDVVLQVADDGVGLDDSTERTGLGLAGMRERIGALGGSLAVRNRDAGRGVCVSARLPRQPRAHVPETEAQS